MMRKVQTGRLGAAFFAAICAIGSALGLSAQTYYWTGAVDNATGTAGNWSLTDGGVAASKAPGQGDTAVFNNTEALSLTKSGNVRYLKYEFNGASVTFPANGSLRHYGYGGGGITATGTGTYTLTYPLELNADQFAGEDKTFVVDVDEGAKVVVQSSGTTKIYSPAVFIKRGGGTYKTTQFIDASPRGDLVFEGGVLTTENSGNPRCNYFGGFAVKGTAAKTFCMYAMGLELQNYSETEEASQTLTFYKNYGNAYDLTIKSTADVPRFSADVVSDNSDQPARLIWDPTESFTITMVDRVWNTAGAGFVVNGGTMRFANGAGIRNLGKGLTVKSGARLEIAESARPLFSGAAVVLESGATLKVEGPETIFKPKSLSYGGVAVPDGRYTSEDLTWLEGDGILVVGAVDADIAYYWTGAAGDSSVSTPGNWAYVNGCAATVAPGTGDKVVFTNATAQTISRPDVRYHKYDFRGANVIFNRVSGGSRQYGYGGGGITVSSSAAVKFPYPLELNPEQFTGADKTFTVDVAKGASVTLDAADVGTLKVYAPAEFVKRGAGEFSCQQFNPSGLSGCGKVTLEAGTLISSYVNDRHNYFADFLVKGPESKTFSLYATNVRIAKYGETADASQTLSFDLTYSKNYAVELHCVEDVERFSADVRVNGGSAYVSLDWNPTEAKTITMVDRQWNSASAKFNVLNGTMKFASGAGVRNLEELSVASGATLEIAADASANFAGAPVVLSTGAKVKVNGASGRLVQVKSVTYDGAAVPDGNYTTEDGLPWLEVVSGVTLVVGQGSKTEATWTGNGGADTSIDNPANWGAVGATTLPDLTSATLVATIPAGACLSVPEGKSFALKGLVLQAEAGAGCTVEGSGSLGLGSSGLVVDGDGTVTINCTVELLLGQVWELGSEAKAGLVLETNAGIVGHGNEWNVHTSFASFKGDGGSCVYIKCANPRLDDSAFNCGVHVSADGALGGPNAKVTIDAGTSPRTALWMSGCTLTNGKITISNLGTATHYRSITTDTGACTIEGDCFVNAPNYNFFNVADGAPLTIGGCCSGALSQNLVRMAEPVFDGYDLTLGGATSMSKFSLSKAGIVRFEASSNVVRRGVFLSNADATIVTTADEAFGFGTTLSSVAGVGFGTGGGTWDLAGTHQSLQMLAGVGCGVITSEEAATLVLDASKDYESDHNTKAEASPTFNLKISDDAKTFSYVDEEVAQLTDCVSFQGQVSFEKKGPKAHYLGGVSTSTGSLTVSEGLLVFKPGATWRTASSVNVTGTGVLEVEGRKIFSSATDLIVDGEATDRIRIAAGKKVIVGSLTVNGVRQGEVPAGLVTGGGTLQIGPDGMTVIVR